MKLKRLIGFGLSLIMTVSSLNMSFAESFAEDIEISDDAVAEDVLLSDSAVGVGEISLYASTLWEYSLSNGKATLVKYNGTSKNINIPSTIDGYTVNALKSYLFYNNTSIVSVNIPSSVENIGPYSFDGCTGIKSVSISNGVKKIGSAAFSNCSNNNFTNLLIPSSVIEIGSNAFTGCTGLKSVTIEDTTNNSVGGCTLGWGVFYGDTNLQTAKLGNGILKTEGGTFYNCSNLTGITIPNSLKAIGRNEFYKCTSITSIYIPSNIESIGSYAFSDCTGIKKLTISDGVKKIGQAAFGGCKNRNLKELVIPGSVEEIGETAFYGCEGITSLTIKKSTNNGIGCCKIGPCAFQNNTALEVVNIEEGVISIDMYVFNDCTMLKSVYLPKSLEKMGVFMNTTPFDGCKSVVLYVYKNSYSEDFAKRYNIPYKYRDKEPVIYTVTYNANGGIGAPSSQTFESGKSVKLSSTKPTRSGYTFLGWAKSSSASSASYYSGSTYTFAQNITLYAVWEKVGNNSSSTIKADINGDGTVTTKDAVLALQMSTGKKTKDLVADVNNDGEVTTKDAVIILRYSTGKIDKF